MQLLPLDTFVDKPALRMMQVHAPEEIPEVQQECQRIIDKFEGKHVPLEGLTREQFYERARKAFAIVYTSEPRDYGCLLLKKRVILPWTREGSYSLISGTWLQRLPISSTVRRATISHRN